MSEQQARDSASVIPTLDGREAGAGTPTAFVLHKIMVRDAAKRDEFEKVAIENVLPDIDTNPDGGGDPDLHFLISRHELGDEYVCLSRLSYSIHHTPLPTWLLNRAEKITQGFRDKLGAFADIAEPQVFYDVAAWRRVLGK
jgi:hypothetical protein